MKARSDEPRLDRDRPAHHRRDLPHLRHQLIELIRIQRLHAVRQRLVRLMMDFDDQAIRADRHRGPRKRSDFVSLAGAVAGINNNRQVAEPLHRRDHAQVERVASVVGESAHAALAQNHVVVAFAHHVLGRHQKFFQRRRHAALHHHRRFERPARRSREKFCILRAPI